MVTFQELINRLTKFWQDQGCIIHQGYDLEKGAGTLNPATFLRCLGPEPYKTGYVEPSRRPTDGRYGENPNRVQHYFQFQVILKPSPPDIQTVYLQSLEAIGLNLSEHDIRFVHDDWENPTIGAAGLGWEAWIDGMEVTQITYFQVCGGLPVDVVTGELTYGIERLAMYLQDVDSIFDLQWNDEYTYGDIYLRNEQEWSEYNFELASVPMWLKQFEEYEREANELIERKLPLPAYDFVMKASHSFNILDARGAISVTERTGYITRIRNLARGVAKAYVKSREEQGFPLIKSPFKEPPQHDFTKEIEALKALEQVKTEDFLLEIGSEELPATFVPIGLKSLEKSIRELLKKEEIPFKDISLYGTPRRLSVIIHEMATKKEAKEVERRGPKISQVFDEHGQITKAGEGFFRSLGMSHPTKDEILSGKNKNLEIRNNYLFATIKTEAVSTADILRKQLPDLISNLSFPKKMRWSNFNITYARPLIWIVSLFGRTVVPFQLANVVTSNTTFGHRQIAPKPVIIDHPKDYVETLRKAHVIVDIEERRNLILKELEKVESQLQGEVLEKDRVLSEVVHLVEEPYVTTASFDQDYLKAPKELLVSEMVEHQKYFPIAKADGELMNSIVITTNNIPSDKIRRGNVKVLSARLSDGVFLYEQDLKVPLDQMNEKLKSVTFQKELGSVWDKVERIISNVKTIHHHLPICEINDALRAAQYCKTDLASAAVFEFPDLQGIMGYRYALAQDETPEVALAIKEHWMPVGEKAPLPESDTGIILSIADKLDNLVGCFAVGLKPTSSSDPYALRRQVLGIIKILIQGQYHLPLNEVLHACYQHLNIEAEEKEVLSNIRHFITQRIKTVFQDYGFQPDIIEASLSTAMDDIYDTFCRVSALHNFRKDKERFQQLFEVYKRAKGQLEKFERMDFSEGLLKEDAEKELNKQLNDIQDKLSVSLESKNYKEAYNLIATLQPPLAKLFDEVRVLADDEQLKQNRLALLQRVFDRFGLLLDFSKIRE